MDKKSCGLRVLGAGFGISRITNHGSRNAKCLTKNPKSFNLRIEDCGLRIADCGLRTVDCGLRTADCGLRITDYDLTNIPCINCKKSSETLKFMDGGPKIARFLQEVYDY